MSSFSIGRFGPYVRHGDMFASLKKEDDPYTIVYDRAVALIEDKKRANAERIIKTFPEDGEVQVLKGRWGPFIQYKGKNLRIPKGKEPQLITWDEIVELAGNDTPIPGEEGFSKRKS